MLAVLTTWLWNEFRWPPWASTSCVALLLALLLLHAADRVVLSRTKAAEAKRKGAEGAAASPDKCAHDAAAFERFRWQYLTVYFLVMFADWLQGTHMYSLYQSYGVNVGALFLTGFLSSAVFGSFIGPIVDRYGRRSACLVYCALEIIINLLENVPDMTVLLIGRVLGGISTSLLFSAFESWMVTEHRARGFAEELIPKTFAIASEGNGILAVLAGFAAQAAADAFGEIGPFRLAVVVTTFAGAFVCSWTENYGLTTRNDNDSKKTSSSTEEEEKAQLDADAYALGLCYSLFDGAMFVFVFLWYPTLEAVVPDGILPSGLVFSSFMLCIAIGGKLFDQISRTTLSGELFASLLCAVSVVALLIPTATDSHMWILGAFFIFELAIGAFAPCCGTLRTRYFPASGLSTTLGLFRLPTNILVVVGTGGASHFTTDQLFSGCSIVLVLSTLCAVKLYWSSLAAASNKKAKTN
uniref:Molybdate-anion transporter n=1 Tax=Globisporangium ultimum (strain ATCC 200006 / CBS 805.95 / DAOM BR144) TaxID=431595 RepID=K3W7G9_GLOUD